MARTVFCGKPFSVRQTLWLNCPSGFSAANTSAAQITATPQMKVMKLIVSVLITEGAAGAAHSFSPIHLLSARWPRVRRLRLQPAAGGDIIASSILPKCLKGRGGVFMHHFTRREFSGILLGAAGAGLLRPFDKVKPSVISGVEIGVQSYTFRKFTIEGMIAEMQKVGLSSVELWNGHLDPMKTSEAEFKAVKKKFDDAGIHVSAYCVNFPKDSSDEHLDRGYNGALLLGTKVMTASVQKSIVPRLDQWSQKYKIKM